MEPFLGVGEYRFLSRKKNPLCIGENQIFQVKKLWKFANFLFNYWFPCIHLSLMFPLPWVSWSSQRSRPASGKSSQLHPQTFHNTMGPYLFIYLFFHPRMLPWHWKPFFTTLHFNTLYLTSHVVFKLNQKKKPGGCCGRVAGYWGRDRSCHDYCDQCTNEWSPKPCSPFVSYMLCYHLK
jgi:hypothetical protein